MTSIAAGSAAPTSNPKKIFWACFIALTATSFTFILRILNMGEIGKEFDLSQTQIGEIMGVGIWPFAVSIVGFSLIIDRIGYLSAIIFAFICHALFAVLTIMADGYWMLYIGAALGGLAAGSIEAAINPIVATLFPKEKTKWLNILHAGWPAGLVLAGIINITCASEAVNMGWQGRIAIMFIPLLAYGAMMGSCKFPANERVAAGVGYREMLQEVGFVGALIAVSMILMEMGRVFEWTLPVTITLIVLLAGGFGLYTRTIGRPLFIALTLTMMPLAITELGTDSWISELMGPEMASIGLSGGWVLVYTSLLMMVLRFCAGPIIHKLSPLGLLTLSAALAIGGLVFLSMSAGITILIAATLYGFGKTFFWPTMLGVVAEQYPKGGALTLNLISGVGMLAAGVIGGPLLGNIQDQTIDRQLQATDTALYQQVKGDAKVSLFGSYNAIDDKKVETVDEAGKKTIEDIKGGAKKHALATTAWFPVSMLISYLLMMLYFKSRGGYKPVDIDSQKE